MYAAIKRVEEKLTHVPLEKENDDVSVELGRRPTLEEFMPLKRRERDSDVEGAEDNCATKNSEQPAWMAKARLWNQTTSRHSSEVLTAELAWVTNSSIPVPCKDRSRFERREATKAAHRNRRPS